MHVFNYIGQIALGVIYGIYLAYFAPASQRQKAKQWYQQRLIAKANSKTTESRAMPTSVCKAAFSQPKIVEPNYHEVEDPWLSKPVLPVKVKQPLPATVTKPLLLAPAKTTKKKDKTPNTVPEAIAQMTALQLRKLCSDRDIKWRNVRGRNKHLTKNQMISALCMNKALITT